MPNKQELPERGIVRVTFELPAQVQGDVVHLVGDFTGWEGTPMEKQNDGSWRTTVDLEPGRSYEFRYLVDGLRWENDWNADRYVANAFGQENSVIETAPLQGRSGSRAQGAGAGQRKPQAKKTSATGKAGKKAAAGQGGATRGTARKAATSGATGGSTAKGPPAAKNVAKNTAGNAAKTTPKTAARKATPSKTAPRGGGAPKKGTGIGSPEPAAGVGGTKGPARQPRRSGQPERPVEPRGDMAAGDAAPDRSSRG